MPPETKTAEQVLRDSRLLQARTNKDLANKGLNQVPVAGGLKPDELRELNTSEGFKEGELLSTGEVKLPEAITTTDGLRRQAAEAGVKPAEVSTFRSEDEFKKFAERVTPAGERPTRPDLVGEFGKLRKESGVENLESQVFSLREERMRLVDEFNRFEEKAGGAETLGVARGRVSEEQRAVQKELDALERRERLATDQLNLKNSTISTIMGLTKEDYSNANSEWNTNFSQNIQLQNAFDTQATREENTARSTLTTMQNALKDTGIKFSTLDPTMKAQIRTLEVQAGLPPGLMEVALSATPEAKVLSTTTSERNGIKYADMVFRAADGSISVKSYSFGRVGPNTLGGEPEVSFKEYLKTAQEELGMSLSPDSDLYKELEAQWKKDYPATTGIGFTDSELKKLEQAGLLGATRKEQLDLLYGDENSDDSPFGE